MKVIHIILLCSLLLIQGISQSFAAPMMSTAMLASMDHDMSSMPCHEQAQDVAMVFDTCCDQDCQCHFLASAMIGQGLLWSKSPVFAEPLFFVSFHSPQQSQNLYRPPIFA